MWVVNVTNGTLQSKPILTPSNWSTSGSWQQMIDIAPRPNRNQFYIYTTSCFFLFDVDSLNISAPIACYNNRYQRVIIARYVPKYRGFISVIARTFSFLLYFFYIPSFMNLEQGLQNGGLAFVDVENPPVNLTVFAVNTNMRWLDQFDSITQMSVQFSELTAKSASNINPYPKPYQPRKVSPSIRVDLLHTLLLLLGPHSQA